MNSVSSVISGYIEKQGKEQQKFFEIPNEEIQSGKIQNYKYYYEFSCSGFSRREDKRVGISKIFLSLFLYIPSVISNIIF